MELLNFWNREYTFMEFLREDLIPSFPLALAALTLIAFLVAWALGLIIFLLAILPLSYLYILISLLQFRSKMKKLPLCRISNDLLILNYDQNVLPWDSISRMVYDLSKERIRVYYRQKKSRFSFLDNRCVSLDLKWAANHNDLVNTLKRMAENKNIPFEETPPFKKDSSL
ncbi:MAG: hypothetical protein WBA22_00365 [Candidatus Methanofastidiosia archaeon]